MAPRWACLGGESLRLRERLCDLDPPDVEPLSLFLLLGEADRDGDLE